jgi:hypothetical protein
LIDDEVLTQVYRIRIGQEFGTAFTIDVDSQQYLVTVDHLIPTGCGECSIDIWRDNAWMSLTGKAIRPHSSDVAAVAIFLTERLSPESTAWSKVDELQLAQQMDFIGFPFGLRTAENTGAEISEIPFVKTGILSAIDSRNPQAVILYVDGHNNPGFSGGPVVFYPQGESEPRIAGVLIGYRWDALPVVKREDLRDPGAESFKDLYTRGNSGIVVAFSIEHLVDAIRKSTSDSQEQRQEAVE